MSQQVMPQDEDGGNRYLALTGARLDSRYEISTRLACGSYAEVYRARDVVTGAAVVVKALNPQLQGACDAALIETLFDNQRQEAALLAGLRHPHIVEFVAAGDAQDLNGRAFHYLVLEYLPGGTLQGLAQGKPLALDVVADLLRQVSAALSYAHEQGVLHRDVKPNNILLTADGRTAKLADFGVARVNHWEGDVTHVGSVCYAAPEHFADAARTLRLTPAADVYALAKTVYFLLSGAAPLAYAQRQITAWPAELDSEPWADAVLRVIQRATANDPRVRPQSVAAFADELEEAFQTSLLEAVEAAETTRPLRSRFVVQAGNGLWKKMVSCSAPSGTRYHLVLPPTEESSRSPQRDYRAVIVWSLVLVLCVGVILTISAVRQEHRQAEAERVAKAPPARMGSTTTEVNIRATADTSRPPVGRIARASRVRILEARGEWLRVEVVRHARPKPSPASADQGWVHGAYVR